MKLEVREERMVVISDLHLGSPASRAAQLLPGFLAHVADEGWPLCINGDAVDLLQYSLPALVADSAIVLDALQGYLDHDLPVRYVFGNHDLVLEHLIQALPVDATPVLNVRSGDALVRIEHGHVHEPVWVRAPGLYELGGRLGRYLLLATGDVYQLWERVARAIHTRRRRDLDEYPAYLAADALFERGFDAIVFGHTHLPERVERPGGTYVNGGAWMRSATYVTIDHGRVALRRWPEDRLPA